MNPLQNTKFVNVSPPVAIKDNSGWTTTSIDTKDWEYCTIIVTLGATDIAMAALKVQESNDDGSADAYADVSALVFGGSGITDIDGAAAALPTDAKDNKVYVFEIDCTKRKRYLDLVATAGDGSTGTFLSAVAILSRGKIAPVSAADRGAEQILRA